MNFRFAKEPWRPGSLQRLLLASVGATALSSRIVSRGITRNTDRSPVTGERGPRPSRVRVLLSPLRGLTELRHNTHGLRRGLWLFRAYGALLHWPLERQDGPRPRSGRYNSSPHACGVPPRMKRAECGRQRTAVFQSSRGSRAASAASKRATRGSRNPDAPTAERSHRVRCSNRTNLDLRP